jgi:RNA polymerase sigma factor (sigma-70 family)
MPERTSPDNPYTNAASNERITLLLRALDKLREPQRRVFIMYEIQGRPVADIAVVEGCTPKTVFTRLYAARQFLLEQLQVKNKGLCVGLVSAQGRWIDTAGI